MALPLFDDPAPPKPRKHVEVRSPLAFAYNVGFTQGADGQGKSFRYDQDDEVNQFYEDGYRIGRLFRPLPVMKEITR